MSFFAPTMNVCQQVAHQGLWTMNDEIIKVQQQLHLQQQRQRQAPSAIEPQSGKKVRFCEVVVFRKTISRHDLSADEKNQYWFKKADFKKMRRDDKRALDSLKNIPVGQKHNFCTRGLEKHIADGKVRYSVNVHRAKAAVLEEQRKQKQLGLHDPESLRYVYQGSSNRCRQEALRQGSKDAFDCMFPTKLLVSSSFDDGDESHLTRDAKKPRFEQHETEANLSIVPVSSSHINTRTLPIVVNASRAT